MKRSTPDYYVFAIVVLLAMFGMLMVFSASYYNAQYNGDAGLSSFTKQALGVGIGLVMMILLSFIDYHIYQKAGLTFIFLMISIVLLIAVLFKSSEINGAKRWIDFGFVSFQPSEIARIALIFFCANYLSRRSIKLRTNSINEYIRIAFPALLSIIIVCGLIIAGEDLSTMLSVLAVMFCIMIVAGTKTKPLLSLMGLGSIVGALLIWIKDYRVARFNIFFNPFQSPTDDGYQLVQSLYALGSGGLTGVGLGNSKQKHLYLTYGDSDFILSIIGEELGFIGVLILVGVFMFLIYRGIKISQLAPDTFGLLLGTGIVSMIAIQVVIHVAVVTSSMPPTGIPLPFISSGNTSLVMFMSAVGVLLNISRQTKKVT